MNRLNFERVSGTVIDVCRGHGTFLDRGELHQIASFIQGGGLTRARQRQIDELKEEEQRLRVQQSALGGHMTSEMLTFVDVLDVADLISVLSDLLRH